MPTDAPPPPDPGDNPEPAPRKLTPALVDAAAALLAAGNFRYVVARSLGVDPGTFRRWMALGRRFPGGLYARLRAAVLAAEGEAEHRAVKQILAAGHAGDSANLRFWLERKFPERWGRDRLELALLKKRVAELEKALGVEPAGEGGPFSPQAGS